MCSLHTSPIPARWIDSRGVASGDFTADGSANDLFIINSIEADSAGSLVGFAGNELLKSDNAGGFTPITADFGAANVDSRGVVVFDFTGDGTANDVYVANSLSANELLLGVS